LASSPSFFSTRHLYFSSTYLLFSIFCPFHQILLASTQKSSLRFAIIHTVDFKFVLHFLAFVSEFGFCVVISQLLFVCFLTPVA
jgi:nitrate reductase NapE component